MTQAGFEALEAQLGAAPPPGLRNLEEQQLQDLADAVRDARRRQAAALAQAGDKAFQHIPKLLRGPIRKVLG